MCASGQEKAAKRLPVAYVYALVDPRDGSTFYIGKGSGGRAQQHAASTRRGRIDNAEKCKRIMEIHSSGLEVQVDVLSEHTTDSDAFAAERVAIQSLRDQLTNIVGGVVTNAERGRAEAEAALRRMKPFAEWVRGMTEQQAGNVAKFFGGARFFYDYAQAHFRQAAA